MQNETKKVEAVFAVSCLLRGPGGSSLPITHTLSVRVAATAEEAVGHAVRYALDERPDFGVVSYLVQVIPDDLRESPPAVSPPKE